MRYHLHKRPWFKAPPRDENVGVCREDRQARLCRMKFIISRGWLYANYPDNNSDHVSLQCIVLLVSLFLVSLNIIGRANVRGSEEEIISLSSISCNVYWLGSWELFCSMFDSSVIENLERELIERKIVRVSNCSSIGCFYIFLYII